MINMKSKKQQDGIVYFNKDTEIDNSQNGNEARISRPTSNIEQTTKRAYADKLVVAVGRKKRKKGICQAIR